MQAPQQISQGDGSEEGNGSGDSTKLADKLELIKEGMTEEQAHKIVNAPPVFIQVPYPHSSSRIMIITVAIFIVLIVIVMLYMIMKYYDNNGNPWQICDRWIDRSSGNEYIISGYNRDTRMAKGLNLTTGKKFLLQNKPGTNTFFSSLDPGVVQLSTNKLQWGSAVWDREVLFY